MLQVPPIKEELVEASASRAHPPADSGSSRAADQGEHREGFSGSASGAHPRAHRGPELPQKYRRRKRQQGKPGRDSEGQWLEAAMGREREKEDEFLQAVSQDETIKEWQAEVYFRRPPELLEFVMRKEGLL